jgi:gas vesicle protein
MNIEDIVDRIMKKPVKYIILIFLVGFAIQFFIQLSFWIGNFCSFIVWDYKPSDIMLYWGNFFGIFLGAIVTIVGVTYSVNSSGKETRKILDNTDNNVKENIRNSILPLIIINRKLSFFEGNLLAALAYEALSKKELLEVNQDTTEKLIPVEPMTRVEKEIDSFYFSIHSNKIIFNHELDDTQKKLINEANLMDKPIFDYLPFTIYNGGLGVAVNMSITIIKDGFEGTNEYHITSLALSMAKNSMMNLALLIYDSATCAGSYRIIINYYD